MGIVSDYTWGKRSPVGMFAIICTMAIFYTLTFTYVGASYATIMVYLFGYGFFAQGVTNTIAASCSADLGRGVQNQNREATSTITGIIDGTGSIGASIA